MLRTLSAILVLGCAATACSPTFNWREVGVEATGLKAMLPCKPDKGARTVPMAGREVELHVLGCDTGGATFAVLHADLGDASRSAEVLGQWKTATLANMRGAAVKETPFRPAGALGLPQSVQVVGRGQRADGSAVEGQAGYFARGSQVFQAVVYADRLKPEQVEPFFSGLRFE